MPTDLRRLISRALPALFLSQKIFAISPDPLDAAPSRFATYDGAKVHYKSLGYPAAKTAVVFVHGWSCDMTSWRAQVPAFERKARVLLVDLPGHGKSDRPVVDYTMDRFAKAVEAVMRDAGVERALLVGHSMGTPVIRQFWRLFPKKTLGLVSVDGALRTYFKDPAQVEKFAAMFSGPDFAKALDGFLGAAFVPSTPENVKADVRKMTAGATQQVAVSAMRGQFDPTIWKDDPIGIPLQVIVAKSANWSADYFAYVKTLNPSAEIHEIPDAGHFVMMEKPGEVNALLLAFASKTGVAGGAGAFTSGAPAP
jgi:pimeloyl-ACP methyl ester carboxylesterase